MLLSSISIYNALLEYLKNILDIKSNSYCHFSEICITIKKGYDKLKKYYIKTNKSYIYSITTSKFFYFFFKLKYIYYF